jgi:hypothetical protein
MNEMDALLTKTCVTAAPVTVCCCSTCRPDLDPAKPWDLKFALPQPARDLLQQQLPLLKEQQQQLQQQAAAQGLQLQGSGMAAGSSSSSSSAAGETGAAPDAARPKKRRLGRNVMWSSHNAHPTFSMLSIIIIIINPCKPYLTASAPRLTQWGGGK